MYICYTHNFNFKDSFKREKTEIFNKYATVSDDNNIMSTDVWHLLYFCMLLSRLLFTICLQQIIKFSFY